MFLWKKERQIDQTYEQLNYTQCVKLSEKQNKTYKATEQIKMVGAQYNEYIEIK